MVGILIVSHGRLAEALTSSVQFLVRNLQRIKLGINGYFTIEIQYVEIMGGFTF